MRSTNTNTRKEESESFLLSRKSKNSPGVGRSKSVYRVCFILWGEWGKEEREKDEDEDEDEEKKEKSERIEKKVLRLEKYQSQI